ncbi:CbtA family protein [Hahella sp. HN01]|uniref:CbtA family protein n=1 Tax=Hahella sp. HN01 TaxID=2847262 RepID=UPI001C1EC90C|nr:CbtA family protein [Hahella sp. HN01]MBU6955470.1 CbtA family protein [Hahella sp. HN01]
MLFQRIILASLLVGLLAGGLLSAVQHSQVTSIILEAETYEGGEEPEPVVVEEHQHAAADAHHSHEHEHGGAEAGGHHHGDDAWAPEDGVERTLYTLLANVLAGIGFSALMLACMYSARLSGKGGAGWGAGLLWGLAGYGVFFVAPALGLPPEIPGMQAAALENRQLWWIATAFVTAVGFALLAFAPGWKKLGGLPLLIIPHLVGAPHTNAPEFAASNPQALQALESLHHQFITAATLTNALFWVIVGLACAWFLRRWSSQDAALQAR